MKKALRRRIAQLLKQQGLAQHQPGRVLLEHIITQALFARSTQQPSLLNQIHHEFHCQNFSELLLFLHEFLAEDAAAVGTAFLSVCRSRDVLQKVLQQLPRNLHTDLVSNFFLRKLITAALESDDFIQQRIILLKLLMQSSEREEWQTYMRQLCHKLGNAPLIGPLSSSEIYWLVYIHLPEEDITTFLRSDTFLPKLIRQLTLLNRPIIQDVVTPSLKKISSLILESTESDDPASHAKNPILYAAIATETQRLIDILCQKLPEVLSSELIIISRLIRWHLQTQRQLPTDKVPPFIAGVIFLRFINSVIQDYAAKLAQSIDMELPRNKFVVTQLGQVVPKILQDITTQLINEQSNILAPAQQALITDQANVAKFTSLLLHISHLGPSFEPAHHCVVTQTPASSNHSTSAIAPNPDSQENLMRIILRGELDVCKKKFEIIMDGEKTDFVSTAKLEKSPSSPFLSRPRTEILIEGREIDTLLKSIQAEINAFTRLHKNTDIFLTVPLPQLLEQHANNCRELEAEIVKVENDLAAAKARLLKITEQMLPIRRQVDELKVKRSSSNVEQELIKCNAALAAYAPQEEACTFEVRSYEQMLMTLRHKQQENLTQYKLFQLRKLQVTVQTLSQQCQLFMTHLQTKKPSSGKKIEIKSNP